MVADSCGRRRGAEVFFPVSLDEDCIITYITDILFAYLLLEYEWIIFCLTLVSAPDQTHCAHVVCDSECVFQWLLHGVT